jgi:hypothetical protein
LAKTTPHIEDDHFHEEEPLQISPSKMTSTTTSLLPPPSLYQTHVTVSPLAGGFITLADNFFVHPADPGAKRTVPSLTFLVTHPGTTSFGANASKPFHMMFDLGLRKSKDLYPEVLKKHIQGRAPYDLPPGVAAQLEAGGLDPKDVDLVMLSHVHVCDSELAPINPI